MPELPEVETVKNGLKNIYINKVIDNVIVNHDNIIANIDVDLFKNKNNPIFRTNSITCTVGNSNRVLGRWIV